MPAIFNHQVRKLVRPVYVRGKPHAYRVGLGLVGFGGGMHGGDLGSILSNITGIITNPIGSIMHLLNGSGLKAEDKRKIVCHLQKGGDIADIIGNIADVIENPIGGILHLLNGHGLRPMGGKVMVRGGMQGGNVLGDIMGVITNPIGSIMKLFGGSGFRSTLMNLPKMLSPIVESLKVNVPRMIEGVKNNASMVKEIAEKVYHGSEGIVGDVAQTLRARKAISGKGLGIIKKLAR